MKPGRRAAATLLCAVLIASSGTATFAASSSYSYNSGTLAGVSTKYITINMNDPQIVPVTVNAGGTMRSTDSVANMAASVRAFAAVNGTYFEAYNGVPVPWGLILRDGKILHISNTGAAMGITKDGKLLIDRISVEFRAYINGEYRCIPWRINHPSTEADAITIFTPEYGTAAEVPAGGRAVLVADGVVTSLTGSNFCVPGNGFAIVYNAAVAHYADERFAVGDTVTYEAIIHTTFTDADDWTNVTTALSSGPSLIINGQVTADGAVEGFWEAKINTNRAGRSFIGADANGKIVIGNMASATLQEAAAACQALGLVNAMCLDGGYSIGLYYNGQTISAGRNVNNALAFVDASSAYPVTIRIDGTYLAFSTSAGIPFVDSASRTQVPLRLTMESFGAAVDWDGATKTAIVDKDGVRVEVPIGQGQILVNGVPQAIDTAAQIVNSRTYLPIRAVVEALGGTVSWDGASRTVLIEQ